MLIISCTYEANGVIKPNLSSVMATQITLESTLGWLMNVSNQAVKLIAQSQLQIHR